MSDNKKWFKVWASLLADPSFQNIRLEDMGRWVLLGALICQQGENGKLTIYPPASIILAMFRVATIDDLKVALLRLPNVQIQGPFGDNGSFIVLMRNWYKYQVDSTHTQRQKRARYKKRGEEKRSYTSTSTPPPASRFGASPPRSRSETAERPEPPIGLLEDFKKRLKNES